MKPVAADKANFGFNTPFAEQIDFFRRKLNLPSERWDDIVRSAHDRGFIVAGAMKADLLKDLNGAVAKTIEQGTGLQAFRKDFTAIVNKNGWTGWTGEGSKAGFAWRTKVIYQTNLATSYAAGRYKQLTDPDFLALRPYWRYVHNDSTAYPRPLHLRWGNMRLTLRHDHPFWQTHFPPNGWGCHCRVTPVDAPEAGDATDPPEGWNVRNDAGNLPGIDKGFDYAPGANSETPLRQIVQDKLITYPQAITKALSRDVNRYINAHDDIVGYVSSVLADKSQAESLWLGFVDNFEDVTAAAKQDMKGFMVLLPDGAPRHVERSHGHDGGDQRPVRPEDYKQVALVLSDADKLQPGKKSSNGLDTVVAWKEIGGELFRCVFEVRPGRNNRALALVSMIIKRAGGG